jgi:hypothetical protein
VGARGEPVKEERTEPGDHCKVDIDGIDYYCVLGSDVDRDGMYLELSRPYGNVILEMFYSDKTGAMTLDMLQKDIPLNIVEWLIGAARQSLPPKL